jgi:hypothetical protein
VSVHCRKPGIIVVVSFEILLLFAHIFGLSRFLLFVFSSPIDRAMYLSSLSACKCYHVSFSNHTAGAAQFLPMHSQELKPYRLPLPLAAWTARSFVTTLQQQAIKYPCPILTHQTSYLWSSPSSYRPSRRSSQVSRMSRSNKRHAEVIWSFRTDIL